MKWLARIQSATRCALTPLLWNGLIARRTGRGESTYLIRIVRGDRDVGHVCIGESQPVVHPGIRRRLLARLGVRFSARRVALWSGRGHLVGGGPEALVSGREQPEVKIRSEFIQTVQGCNFIGFR